MAKQNNSVRAKLHWSLSDSWQRLIESIMPMLQITLAATIGYAIAHFLLGHHSPIFAVTVTITSLGFSRDTRPIRIVQTATGMVLGIAISEILQGAIGIGWWQLSVVLLTCLIIARFITSSAVFAIAAGSQSMLVFLVAAPEGGPFIRSLDGLIGGLTALLITALIPRDPRGIARGDAEKLFTVFLDSLEAIKLALKDSNQQVADFALVRVRRTQPLIDNWRLSLDSAAAIAKVSPFLRKYQDDLAGQIRILRGMDLATRNLRVIVRRIDFLLRDGIERPYLAELFDQIEEGSQLLSEGLKDDNKLNEAQAVFLDVIHQLDPKRFGIADQLREASVLLLLRPLLIDLLCASGMNEEDARAELPNI